MITGNVRGMKEYLRIPADGSQKSAETVVRGGFDNWAQCVDQIYDSQTFGRMILALDDRRAAE